MLQITVANNLTDLSDLHVVLTQQPARHTHAVFRHQPGKRLSCKFPDQPAEIRRTVIKIFRRGLQSRVHKMVLQVLKDFQFQTMIPRYVVLFISPQQICKKAE